MKNMHPAAEKGHQEDGLTTQPFANLGKILAKRRKRELIERQKPGTSKGSPSGDSAPDDDLTIFYMAMEGVVPLRPREGTEVEDDVSLVREGTRVQKAGRDAQREDLQVLQELRALIKGYKPITVRYTPEYVEGIRGDFAFGLAKKLHNGAFAIQAYCDLHGMDSIAALETCEEFMAGALKSGKKCVALIHGRGLSSPGEPVLKRLVIDWLSHGPYRKHVLAFASAPSWDGGAGVTYVLLGKRPIRCRARKTGRNIHARG